MVMKYLISVYCISNITLKKKKQRLFDDNTLSIREIFNEIRYKLDIEIEICENHDKQMNFGKYDPLYNMLNSI